MSIVAKLRSWFGASQQLFATGVSAASLDAQRFQLEREHFIRELLASGGKYEDPRCLNHFEHRLFSQDGGDGILAEIFRRIGVTDGRFVEFGVQDGLETNSTALLLKGWSGVWIEGDSQMASAARSNMAALPAGRLQVVNEFITAENIEDVFSAADLPSEFDFLSIDIDGNDYWVWAAIKAYSPRVVEVEYNSTFPPDMNWVMKYDPAHQWDETMHFGASLGAFEALAKSKGYCLVGCSLAGTNAFFVRQDLIGDAFAGPLTAQHLYEAPRYPLILSLPGHKRRVGQFEVTA